MVDETSDLGAQPKGLYPASSNYGYADGNITSDDGKGLDQIDYNLLNLPTYLVNNTTHDEMLFEYAFGGEKLKKVSVIDDTIRTRLYMGGFEFLDDEPEAFHHGEGRIVLTDSLPRFQYKIADHLGNTVVLFEDKDNSGTISTIIPQDPEDAEVVQRNLYYPFGMQLDGTWKHLTVPRADYLYNGKELEEELGLNWLAFGFRYADPAIGRFTGVDPIADQFAWVSPFNYAENEPVGHIDLWGLQKTKPDEVTDNSFPDPEPFSSSFPGSTGKSNSDIATDVTLPEIEVVASRDNNSSVDQNSPYGASETGVIGGGLSVLAKDYYNSSTWRGNNGKYYSLNPSPGNTRPFYGNQYTGGVSAAKNKSALIGRGGSILSIYSI